jgi:hypothetical protein
MQKNSLTLLFIVVLFLGSCVNNSNLSQPNLKSDGTKKHKNQLTTASIESSSDCDPIKWKHVYDPERLEVLDKCKVVTGIITERNADPDGDEHMLLKLDKGQKDLLTKKNKTKKDGCLVIEAVCVNKITRKRAIGICDGYGNDVWLPKVGDHVKVTGSYVLDSNNGWTEIHPITKIEKMK